MWDRIDDAYDDERYGTLGELQSEIEALEARLRAAGRRVPPWTPPWEGQAGYTVQAQRVALYCRAVDLREAVQRAGIAKMET